MPLYSELNPGTVNGGQFTVTLKVQDRATGPKSDRRFTGRVSWNRHHYQYCDHDPRDDSDVVNIDASIRRVEWRSRLAPDGDMNPNAWDVLSVTLCCLTTDPHSLKSVIVPDTGMCYDGDCERKALQDECDETCTCD